MTEDLCTPGFADQVIMLQNPAMRLELGTRLEGKNKMFMPQTDKLGQITVSRDGRRIREGHRVILSRPVFDDGFSRSIAWKLMVLNGKAEQFFAACG
jgi:hypothetical protein